MLRLTGRHYVDKTDLVYLMANSNSYYFLNRPRRFGKSLLISTLRYYFEGRKELFQGLKIDSLESEWASHPVLLFDFAKERYGSLNALRATIESTLSSYEEIYGITKVYGCEWGIRLSELIAAAHRSTGALPVVLIDEYDSPLMDCLENSDLRASMRSEMRKLLSALKGMSGELRFVFLTGISKFSQMSIFSELNNLDVITMDDCYSGICGVTKDELFSSMQPEIQALADSCKMTYDEACEALRRKYDGYHFSERGVDVYNPFSLMQALSKRKLDDYWFSTGTPAALAERIGHYEIEADELDRGFEASKDMFDVPLEMSHSPIPMLYQCGYLTIKDFEDGVYTLAFPNEEVRTGFYRLLLPFYANASERNSMTLIRLQRHLKSMDVEAAMLELKSFFSSIPYDVERKDERHYRTVIYILFRLLTQYEVHAEAHSAAGCADVVVRTATAVYLFEFKVDGNGSVKTALEQIDAKGYMLPYVTERCADGKPKRLFKVAVVFDVERRTLGDWMVVEEGAAVPDESKREL